MHGRVGYELTGQKFGRLTVVKRSPEVPKSGHIQWECLCDCGKEILALGTNLVKKNTMSCGCLRREIHTTHGLSSAPEYCVWEGIIQRCTNPNYTQYRDYGGRGITVCDRWKNSFENFYNDVGPRPEKGYTIDREDNNKGYEPGNCRWVTRREQMNNRRNNVYYEFKGKEYQIHQLMLLPEVIATGISIHALRYRLATMGWTVEYSITRPFQERVKRA